MKPIGVVLQKPADEIDEGNIKNWFQQIADCLLNKTSLIVNSKAHRIAEIECYFVSEEHPDFFGHRHPLQLELGKWYFHRAGKNYRNGSFKGLDLTLGDGEAFGGILIRSIVNEDDKMIEGPSLGVDYLLKQTGSANIAELDDAIDGRVAWDDGNPLRLEESDPPREQTVYSSARVGLTLKRVKTHEAAGFLLTPYRFLTEPRRIKKGRVQLVLALYQGGLVVDEICRITGSPRHSARRHVEEFENGKGDDIDHCFGKELNALELCSLHGMMNHALYGRQVTSCKTSRS